MESGNCKPSVVVYNMIIVSLCKDRLVTEALDLLLEMTSKGIPPDVVTYNCLIRGLYSSGQWKEATRLFNEMVDRKISQNGDLSLHEFFNEIQACGQRPDLVTYNLLLDGLCQNQCLDEAMTLFHLIEDSKFKPNIITYGILIDGMCKAGKLKAAMELFCSFPAKGLEPSVSTYNIIINGLYKEGLLDEANELLVKWKRMINIFLKVTKTVTLKVNRSDTIENVKALFRNQEGILEKLQELFFAGNHLKDAKSLADYDIRKDSTLHLVLQNAVLMKIFVKIPANGKTVALEVKACNTIQNIKSIIQDKEGIPKDQYTLIYAGRLLEDNQTLASLNIMKDSTLHVVFNPRDVMLISVKTPRGEIMKIEVKIMYTIRNVKTIVGSMMGFPTEDQKLFYAGKQLDDCQTLAYYNIKEESILDMKRPVIQIFVKTWDGKTITLEVESYNSVSYIMDKINHKLGMQSFHSLVFAGKWLEGGRNLTSYNIQPHSTLHMVLSPSSNFRLIYVKTLSGSSIMLRVKERNTILDVKAMIQKKMGKPVAHVCYDGNVLSDQSTLALYGIQKHSILDVVFNTSRQSL
ncbi:hypothetical protein HHK36_012896 [Tetracentron sinense]|uniref:Ubiquitin-like domain-containing protein n=1 Tax=Tetracentron sinense TaxID=13715 RepID=A0A834Z7M2_TETSI|nr:hypothetical protein HHK36_012896 [Tetracentron sinense]